MTELNNEASPVNVKVTGVLDKFDGDGTDPQNLVERVHVEDAGEGQWKVVKVEYFDGADNKTGEEIVEEGGTN